ncbi:MAG: hypothetical protein K2L51_02075, partial [Clostridiales bacterium]|nr:hypothetical protein [Clostridiales bacterium]
VCALFCLAILPLCAAKTFAKAQAGDFAGGSGTAADPYLVATAEQLDRVRYYRDAHFRQTDNLDLADVRNFAPIGSVTFPFAGRYDGGKYAIRNLRIVAEENNAGLFAYVQGGEICNVKIEQADVRGAYNVGGVAGANNGTIVGCTFGGTVTGQAAVGGIAGLNASGGTVRECGNRAEIRGGISAQTGNYIGGIAGVNNGAISDCYNRGGVQSGENAPDAAYVGGIAGVNNGESARANIHASFNAGAVGGRASGQIAGDNQNGSIGLCKWQTGAPQVCAAFNAGTVTNVRDVAKSAFGKRETFRDWENFDSVWRLSPENDYPILQREYVAVERVEFDGGARMQLQPGESRALQA